MPDDEGFDYLATQAIADFLATENCPVLDGIIFRSVQVKDGRNVVLFHKATRVEPMDIPERTEIEAQLGFETEDGWVTNYSVTEHVQPAPSLSLKQNDGWSHILPSLGTTYCFEGDLRERTLQIDPNSVVVHQVNWVEYGSTTDKVFRHR
jgi:hypothetical protein